MSEVINFQFQFSMILARKVLMVEPVQFEINPEIISDNFFLKNTQHDKDEIRKKVLDDSFSSALTGASRDYAESGSNIWFAFVLALI